MLVQIIEYNSECEKMEKNCFLVFYFNIPRKRTNKSFSFTGFKGIFL